MPCKRFQTCPLFNFFSSHPILNLWRIEYCDKPDNSHCARFQNSSKGISNPVSMLPNGNLVESAPLTLLNAVTKNRVHLVKNVLSNINFDIDFQDINGTTALMIAAEHGYPEMLKIIMEHGANIDIKNYNNETAHDIAMKKNHTEIMNLLQKVEITDLLQQN